MPNDYIMEYGSSYQVAAFRHDRRNAIISYGQSAYRMGESDRPRVKRSQSNPCRWWGPGSLGGVPTLGTKP